MTNRSLPRPKNWLLPRLATKTGRYHDWSVESITNLKSKYTQNLSKELNDVQLQRHDIQERNRKNVHALENEFYILAERNRKMRRRKLKK